jgi:hypothetical protein
MMWVVTVPFVPVFFAFFLTRTVVFGDKRDKILDKLGTNETKN